MSGGHYFDSWYNYKLVLLMPALGYRAEVHRKWSFQTNIAPVFNLKDKKAKNCRLWLLNYGLRGHGETIVGDVIFGDLGFILPISKSYFNGIGRSLPFGIPYFSLGLHF